MSSTKKKTVKKTKSVAVAKKTVRAKASAAKATSKSTAKKVDKRSTAKTKTVTSRSKSAAKMTKSRKLAKQAATKKATKAVKSAGPARQAVAPVKPPQSKGSIKSIIGLNWLMFAVHLIQGIAVLVLGVQALRRITTQYLQNGPEGLEAASRGIFDMNITVIVALFFFISSFAHFFIAGTGADVYKSDLRRGVNRMRWIEYSISASVMMVLIGILSGLFDIGGLIGVFVLTMVMNLLGMVMELWNADRRESGNAAITWVPFNIGVIAGAAPWIIVGISLWASETASTANSVPSFVYAIYVSLFLLFNCFAINMWLQYKKIGPWKNYLFGERMYVILSLVAKSALAWQIFFGTLQPL